MEADILLGGLKQFSHLLLRQPQGFVFKTGFEPDRASVILVKNYLAGHHSCFTSNMRLKNSGSIRRIFNVLVMWLKTAFSRSTPPEPSLATLALRWFSR